MQSLLSVCSYVAQLLTLALKPRALAFKARRNQETVKAALNLVRLAQFEQYIHLRKSLFYYI